MEEADLTSLRLAIDVLVPDEGVRGVEKVRSGLHLSFWEIAMNKFD
jgi:hypothetical protein